MSDTTKFLVRNAREQDIPAVAEIHAEAFSPNGTAAEPETFQRWLTAFPDGFVILVAENEIAAYGCSEKWLAERRPGVDENASTTHQLDGKIFCIKTMAVRKKFRGRGYGRRILDSLLEIAHLEGCKKVVLETADAQGFFQKRGFQVVEQHTEQGIPLHRMSLELKPITLQ
jgi:ribosomal protein S18 acetylase RimI-like enzyme